MPADFAPTTQLSPFDEETEPRVGLVRRWLRRCSSDLHDARTGLLNRQGLLARGNALLARRGCRRATLVVLDFDDLLESADLWGDRALRALLAQLTRGLQRVCGRRGLAARTGPAQFAVLLPGHCRQSGVDAVTRVFGQPCRLELDWKGEELVCVPDVAAEVWEGEADGVLPIYAHLCAVLARHRERRERRHDFIRRERERHSRPMGLSHADSELASLPG